MPYSLLRRVNVETLPSVLANLLGFPPHDGQIEAIRTLAFDQLDLILIAPTGWGKSIVFQTIPVLRGGICLMIMPLNLLEEDQVSHEVPFIGETKK
jgi:superfamily II DNA helicase RecQ